MIGGTVADDTLLTRLGLGLHFFGKICLIKNQLRVKIELKKPSIINRRVIQVIQVF